MATETINFTKAVIESLPLPPQGKRQEYADIAVPGLRIRVSSTGHKSFLVYRKTKSGRPTRVTLGKYPDLKVEAARDEARKAIGELAKGHDINAEAKSKRAKGVTLKQVFDAYMKTRDLKEGTIKDYNRVMDEAFDDWKKKPITSISRDMVERRHNNRSETSSARANNEMRVLRALFNYAIARYEDADGNPILSDNPVKRLSATKSWNRIPRRRSVIRQHELKKWWKSIDVLAAKNPASNAPLARDYIFFVLLTGMRREEAARLKWVDIDLPGKLLRIPDPKNRMSIEIPLSDFSIKILKRRRELAGESAFVFPGPGKQGHIANVRRWIERSWPEAGLKWTLHDLRRTYSTIAESLDLSRITLKRLLNHKVDEQDVTAGYVQLDIERLRQPQQLITDTILSAAGVSKANKVVEIDTHGANRG